ncbi:MAG: hypothetical protein ABL874_03300 [Sphingopyxis sp.]
MTASLQRLGEAIDRLETAVADISVPKRPPNTSPKNADALRGEVAATIAELDRLIGQHRG